MLPATVSSLVAEATTLVLAIASVVAVGIAIAIVAALHSSFYSRSSKYGLGVRRLVASPDFMTTLLAEA